MSYSKWLSSHWYTYWLANNSFDRDNQIFEVGDVETFTYQELKDDINKCLIRVKEKDPKASDDLIEELKTYMKEFLWDVEHDKNINEYTHVKEANFEDLPTMLDVTSKEAVKLLEKRIKGA